MLGLLTLDWRRLFEWQRTPSALTEESFRALERSGVNVFHPAVETSANDAVRGASLWIARWNRLLTSRVCFLERVERAGDLSRLAGIGKLGVIVGLQNANHFRKKEDVRHFFDRGQRVSQLTYNARNALGSGCYESRDRGLTPFGAAIVEEMNATGMAVDVSHCGERTSVEAIEASRKPVLVTHSNCRALVPRQPRCKSDRVIRAMAAKGGVMGITVVRAFVGTGAPDVEDVLDHFEHVARLVGIEYVGLGSDVDVAAIDPATGRPAALYVILGLDPVARVFQIADGLLRRGFSTDDVRLVLGGNFLRALGEIWPEERAARGAVQTRRDPFCPPPVRKVPGA